MWLVIREFGLSKSGASIIHLNSFSEKSLKIRFWILSVMWFL